MTIKRTLELPETHGIARSHGSCTVHFDKLSDDMLINLLCTALDNKLGDTVSGLKAALGGVFHDGNSATKDADLSPDDLDALGRESSAVMNEALAALERDEWSQRRASESDPLERYVRAIIRDKLRAKAGKAWNAYKAIKGDQPARDAMLDAIFEKQTDSVQKGLRKTAADRKAADDEAKRKAAELVKATDDLDI